MHQHLPQVRGRIGNSRTVVPLDARRELESAGGSPEA
jgi:hypothetical protein